MKHNYCFEYEGIKLLPLDACTSEMYRSLRNNSEIRKWFTFKGTISEEQQLEWYERYIANPKDVMFAIYNDNNEFIGCNSVYDIQESGIAEYGRLIIDPVYSGKGYGYKATYAVVQIARDQMKLKRLKLEVYEENHRAIQSYKKAGFLETGSVMDEHGDKMLEMELNL